MSSTPEAGEWLLLQQGQVQGPFSRAYVEMLLGAGKLTSSTPICRKGTEEWLPIDRQPQFQGSTVSTASAVQLSDIVVWDPALPNVVNALGWYAWCINPLLTCMWFLDSLGSTPTFAAESRFAVIERLMTLLQFPFDIGIPIALAYGSHLLTKRRKYAVATTIGAIAAHVVYVFSMIALVLALLVLATAVEEQPFATATSDLSTFVILVPLAFAGFGFEVFCLFWLWRNRQFIEPTN